MPQLTAQPRVSWEQIATSVTNSILAGRLLPGNRIGEASLAGVFAVSRTVVRQALGQLASRGILVVRPKRGWFVVEPTEREVREVFATRRLIQGGLLKEIMGVVTPDQLRALEDHVGAQHRAIAENDIARRSYLLNDFDVEIARMTGNDLLAKIIAELAMRTTLASMLYQTIPDARASADEHAEILRAIEAKDETRAIRLMDEHLRHVEASLQIRRDLDPVQRLRETLAWRPAYDAAVP
jgi:DNA-binding GntR family transcriptional regulator